MNRGPRRFLRLSPPRSELASVMSMKRLSLLLALLVTAGLAPTVMAQGTNTNVVWKLLTPEVSGAPGSTVQVKIQASLKNGHHLYTTKTYVEGENGAPQSTEVTVGDKALFTLDGRLRGPKPVRHMDPSFEIETEYWEGTVVLTVPVKIAKGAKPGTEQGWVNLYFMTCNDATCIPPTDQKFTFKVTVDDKASVDAADSLKALQQAKADSIESAREAREDSIAQANAALDQAKKDSIAQAGATSGDSASNSAAGTDSSTVSAGIGGGVAGNKGSLDQIVDAKNAGLWAFLATAALAGLLALGTPCVYPMIPITVSFFTKRKSTTRGRALRDALLYSFGIILTFTGLGFLLTVITGGAGGIQDFASSPWVNIFIAAIFLVLALNLFGLFEIQLPTSILNKLNRKADGEGVGGVILMGFVFSLTSFTCTVPFVSSVFLLAAKGEFFWPLLGSAAFATIFSLPFFLLALFPSFMKAMPKSGGWLNAVKVVLGFIEVAFAVRYVSNADLVWDWGIFTRELVLSIWIACSVLITVYLLGRFQLPHDTPVERVGPVRVLMAVAFLGISFWLLQGMFGGSIGEVDAYVPPPREGVASASFRFGPTGRSSAGESGGMAASLNAGSEEAWIKDDYEAALKKAKETGKPLFVDFTGYSCTNCRWMERTIFPKKEVSDLMNRYVLVRLYTDGRDEVNKKNRQMQIDRFNTIELPFYVLMTPDEKAVASTGMQARFTPEQFTGFLRRGLAGTDLAMR